MTTQLFYIVIVISIVVVVVVVLMLLFLLLLCFVVLNSYSPDTPRGYHFITVEGQVPLHCGYAVVVTILFNKLGLSCAKVSISWI